MEKINIEKIQYENVDLGHTLEIEKLEVAKGSFFCLFGEEAEAKADLLKLCCGMKRLTEGAIEMNTPKAFGERDRFRFVPEEILFEANMTGAEYFDFCKKRSTRYGRKIEHALCKKLVHANWESNVLEMTYQENKLVSLIGAISARPDILFLDRPETYLDRTTIRELYKILRVFAKKGMTIVVSTSDYKEIMDFYTDYAFIDHGRVLQTGRQVEMKCISKIVTIINPENKEYEEKFDMKLAEEGKRNRYVYKEADLDKLNQIIESSKCEDFYVEQMPFEQWIRDDVKKWEE